MMNKDEGKLIELNSPDGSSPVLIINSFVITRQMSTAIFDQTKVLGISGPDGDARLHRGQCSERGHAHSDVCTEGRRRQQDRQQRERT